MNNNENKLITVIASWIYVLGLIIVALGETRATFHKIKKHNENKLHHNLKMEDLHCNFFEKKKKQEEEEKKKKEEEKKKKKEIEKEKKKEHKQEEDFHHGLVALGEYIESFATMVRGLNSNQPNKRIGDLLSSLGSGLAGTGAQLQIIEETDPHLLLEGLGDTLQTTGPLISAKDEESYLITVSLFIESLGAFIETIGIIFMIQDYEIYGQIVLTIGTWIQTIGGYFVAYFETQEFVNLSKR